MGPTTLTVDEEVRERVEEHRGDAHHSVEDVLVGMMRMLPPVEAIMDGCENCGDDPFHKSRPEKAGGVIWSFHVEEGGEEQYISRYFCSPECAKEKSDEEGKWVPEHPDKVVVGGVSELRTEFEDASFYMDRDVTEVGLDIPGAFGGTDSHGNEYDYEGEPVYVKNEGHWVQDGVIEDIIHEESHTALILGRDHEKVMLNHPDDEKRENYEEMHAKQNRDECAQCGASFQYSAKEPPEECPDCGAEEW